jgi:plasmid stabilization system protein ParE
MTAHAFHHVVWKISDQAALERELAVACARLSETPSERPQVADILDYFLWEIQSFPLEWPSSPRPPSEHTWRFGRVVVHYRRIPDAQTVEIISVTGFDG